MNFSYISNRALSVNSSPNAAASLNAKELISRGIDIIDLTIGEPDFETPDHIRNSAINAIINGATKYSPILGIKTLRDAVAKQIQLTTKIDYNSDRIIISNGAKQVISNAIAASTELGDEIVVPAPYYPSFVEIAKLNGGKPVVLKTLEKNNFKFTCDSLANSFTDKTKWLIINSPSNPSGAVYSNKELAVIAEFLRSKPNVLVLLDEVYDKFIYTTKPHHLLKIAPDLIDRVLLVNSFSKTYAMTGWRIGYGAGPLPLIKAMGAIQSQTTSGVSSISQAAALSALTNSQLFVEDCLSTYRERREYLAHGLSSIPGISVTPPEGGLFMFAGCQRLLGKKKPDGGIVNTDVDIVDYILSDAGVACISGTIYGYPGYIRISLAATIKKLGLAVNRIAKSIGKLQ